MKIVSVKKGLLLFYLFDVILLIVLIISFLPFAKKNEIKSMQTALLNPNKVNQVSSITLSKFAEDSISKETITLQKSETFWIGYSSLSNNSFFWPCDMQTVQNLITEAQKITTVYTKSDNVTAWKNLCVDDKQSTVLTFYDENKNIISQLFFGSKDELTQRIYFRTWTKSTVYEIDNAIESFLSVKESFWVDPFLFPQCVTGFSRAESESLLRRGTVVNISPREGLPVDTKVQKDFGNGSVITFNIYKKDNEYIVLPTFVAPLASSASDKNAIQKLNYRYTISSWTYEKFMQELANSQN